MKHREPGFEIRRRDHLVVQLHHVILIDGNREDFGRVDAGLCGGTRRHNQVDAVFNQRGRDHEDDQQHERQVEKRGDIDFRERLQALP